MYRGNNVLWMGDLESYMDGDFIGEAYRLMGEQVNSVKIVMDKYDGHRAGYCFVELADEPTARRAMLQINGRVIPNTKPPIKFNLSFANNPAAGATEYNLFVNNLPEQVGDAELYQLFGHSYKSCRGAKVYKNPDNSNRGSGFVRFGDETDQQRAFIEMNRKSIYGRPIMLKMAPVRIKKPRHGASADYDPSTYYRNYQDYYNSSQWQMYDYQKANNASAGGRRYQTQESPRTPINDESSIDKVPIVLDGLELYTDGLAPEEAEQVFMHDSEEVYQAMRDSCWFANLHTAAVTFDDL